MHCACAVYTVYIIYIVACGTQRAQVTFILSPRSKIHTYTIILYFVLQCKHQTPLFIQISIQKLQNEQEQFCFTSNITIFASGSFQIMRALNIQQQQVLVNSLLIHRFNMRTCWVSWSMCAHDVHGIIDKCVLHTHKFGVEFCFLYRLP